jgi:hypothetical protein
MHILELSHGKNPDNCPQETLSFATGPAQKPASIGRIFKQGCYWKLCDSYLCGYVLSMEGENLLFRMCNDK